MLARPLENEMNNKKTRQWQTAAGEGGVRVRGEHYLQQQQIRPTAFCTHIHNYCNCLNNPRCVIFLRSAGLSLLLYLPSFHSSNGQSSLPSTHFSSLFSPPSSILIFPPIYLCPSSHSIFPLSLSHS